MKTKFMLALGVCAMAIVSAASTYHVTFDNPAWIAGNELKPGDYTIKVDGDKVILKQGKNVVETAAKVETNDKKFDTTSFRLNDQGGKPMLEEIRVGGTHTKIVFEGTPNGANGTE
jgi:hypothetical protein